MKIKIQKITKKQVTTKFGPKTNYGILNADDNQWYSCFEHPDMKDWKEGDTVEANVKVNGQYRNIEFPKREKAYQAGNSQLVEAMKIQMDRIEKKIDRIMGVTVAVMPVDEPLEMPKDYYEKHGLPTDIPPPPTDDDTPF